MEIRVENTSPDAMPHDVVSVEPGYTYGQPTVGTDSASFPEIPQLKRFAIAGVVAFGTVSVSSQPVDLSAFENCAIVVSAVLDDEASPLAAQYLRLREDIVASGIPMLSDEELRNEIRERRGIRSETED